MLHLPNKRSRPGLAKPWSPDRGAAFHHSLLQPSVSHAFVSFASMKPHILVVDDDPAMRELLTEYLGDNDLRVTAVATGGEMKATLAAEVIDLVVLDLRLNGEDGMQLARGLREQSAIPVIIVTGKQEEADRVMGLEMAADDYVTKPFSNRELLARIRAVLRRYQLNPAEPAHGSTETRRRAYRFSGWELNVLLRRLTTPDGERVELSNGEFNLLLAFCEAPRRVLSRDRLLELSRLHGAEVYDRSIDVSILRLRRKIEVNAAAPQYIKTERGAGYIFDSEVEVLG
ncbi:MAG: DNA-binding response regulator [Rhodoferax sp.]|nr:DNA-binding response regulator [Rhodoferax sp.]